MRSDIEKEIQRILPMIPKEPPEHSIEILKKRGFLKDERLLYSVAYKADPVTGGKAVRVQCSHCGGEAILEHVPGGNCRHTYGTYGFIDPMDKRPKQSGEACVCPICGIGMTALLKSSFRAVTEIDSRMYMSVHNVEGHLVILSWCTKKMLRSDGSVEYWTKGFEGVVVIEKTLVRIKKYEKFMSSYSWLGEWTYTQRFVDILGQFSKAEVIDVLPITVERTDCAHSALAEYLKSAEPLDPVHYIKLWLKHPNVENLVRQGLSNYVSAVIERSNGYNYYKGTRSFDIKNTGNFIAWEEAKPSAMLGLTKDELNIARSVSFEGLQFYRRIKDRLGLRLNVDMLERIKKYRYDSVERAVLRPRYVEHVSLVHLINYLDNQRSNSGRSVLIDVNYLEDYWKMCVEVYGNVPLELAYPKNLIRAHNDILSRVREKEDEELKAGFEKRFTELSEMSYQDETIGLMIRPAASQCEMIEEGKILNHCVGRYAESHAKGDTSIFFIRKICAPEVPYYTLEYKNGVVNQNRGSANCARTEEVAAFENEWLKFIKTLKERKGDEKRNSKADQYAGA